MTCGANLDGATCLSIACGSACEDGADEDLWVVSSAILGSPSEYSGPELSD